MAISTSELRKRLVRMLERRYGQSVLPIRVLWLSFGFYRVVDDETGTFIEVDARGKRLRVVKEEIGTL